MSLSDEIETCETAVWQALAAGDAVADRNALAEDFLGVYPDGFAGREDHVAQVSSGSSIASFTLSDVRVLGLGPDHALIAYHARYQRPRQGKHETMYVSSVWRRSPGGWVNVFSQDTPAKVP